MCEKKLCWLSGSITPTSASLYIAAHSSSSEPWQSPPLSLFPKKWEKKKQTQTHNKHQETNKCGIHKNFFPLPLPIALCLRTAVSKSLLVEDGLFLYCLCSSTSRNKAAGDQPVEWEPGCTWHDIAKEADFTRLVIHTEVLSRLPQSAETGWLLPRAHANRSVMLLHRWLRAAACLSPLTGAEASLPNLMSSVQCRSVSVQELWMPPADCAGQHQCMHLGYWPDEQKRRH